MSEPQDEAAAIWISLLVEHGSRARVGRAECAEFRRIFAASPSRLRDIGLIEALLA